MLVHTYSNLPGHGYRFVWTKMQTKTIPYTSTLSGHVYFSRRVPTDPLRCINQVAQETGKKTAPLGWGRGLERFKAR